MRLRANLIAVAHRCLSLCPYTTYKPANPKKFEKELSAFLHVASIPQQAPLPFTALIHLTPVSLTQLSPIRDSPLPVCGDLSLSFPRSTLYPIIHGKSLIPFLCTLRLQLAQSLVSTGSAISASDCTYCLASLISCLSYLCYPSGAWPIFRPLYSDDSPTAVGS